MKSQLMNENFKIITNTNYIIYMENIGEGRFGQVYFAMNYKKPDRTIYACKQIKNS